MKRRKWDAKATATIILEGLKGKSVAELCTEHQINQAQYYQWRDHFLAHAGQAVEVHQQSQRETRLQQGNARLKQVVGELTLELKKPTRFGHDATGGSYGRGAECRDSGPDRSPESGASLWGLSARVGVSPVYNRLGRPSQTDLTSHA